MRKPQIVAVIPARVGSKRMPKKNFLELEPGITLVQQAIDCAVDSGVIDFTAVLTDLGAIPYKRAALWAESEHDAGECCDISMAVANAVRAEERKYGIIDYVVTLQPAVVARSPLIVKRVVQAVLREGAGGAVTAARTVPWLWSVTASGASNGWTPAPYPRSTEAGVHLAEINAVQVTSRDAILRQGRWATPLLLAELPHWAAALDIDEPADLARARDMWGWAKTRLETWEPTFYRAETINGWKSTEETPK